jgi:hypothetical protein
MMPGGLLDGSINGMEMYFVLSHFSLSLGKEMCKGRGRGVVFSCGFRVDKSSCRLRFVSRNGVELLVPPSMLFP